LYVTNKIMLMLSDMANDLRSVWEGIAVLLKRTE